MNNNSLLKIASLRVQKPIDTSISATVDFASPITPSCALSPASPYAPDYALSPSSTALAHDDDSAAKLLDDTMNDTFLCAPENNTRSSMKRSTLFSGNDLLLCLSQEEDHTIEATLAQNGYKLMRKISDTLQGSIYEAEIIDAPRKSQRVAIKQSSKDLYRKKEAQIDGFNYIVEENIVKEATILKYLTKDNRPGPLYIAKFIEWFETEDDFYLVMEYAGDCNLADFVAQAHAYIAQKRLSLKAWKKVVKFLFWQISATIEYMHSMGVCHLDLTLDNILVRDGLLNFMEKDGIVTINQNVCTKLADFGLAEVFHPKRALHSVQKWGLRSSFSSVAPNVYAELPYDGKKADIWSAGTIFYQLLTGQSLYTLPEEMDVGYYSLSHKLMNIHLQTCGLLQHFGKKSLYLLLSMLKVNEKKRICAMDILKASWFSSYYARYAPLIAKRNKLLKNQPLSVTSSLPYYK